MTAPLFLLGEEVVRAHPEPEGFVTCSGVEGQPGDWWVEADDGREWAATDELIARSYEPVNRAALEVMREAGVTPRHLRPATEAAP